MGCRVWPSSNACSVVSGIRTISSAAPRHEGRSPTSKTASGVTPLSCGVRTATGSTLPTRSGGRLTTATMPFLWGDAVACHD